MDPINKTRVLRILVHGDNASEKMGGEATKPLRLFRGYRERGHECVLVTHERCRRELETILKPAELAHVSFINDNFWHRLFSSKASRMLRLSRLLVPLVSQIALRRAILRGEFGSLDVVHQTTPISLPMPSALSNLPSPVVFGPLARGVRNPPGFGGRDVRTLTKNLWDRSLSVSMNRLFTGKRNAALIYCEDAQTMELLKGLVPDRVPRKLELVNGLEEYWREEVARERPEGIPTFVFAGRLVPYKAVDILIDAAGRFKEPVELVIIGDGAERENLMAQAAGYQNVKMSFVGWRTRQEIRAYYASATGAVSLALREAGGTSVQEAMASGTPLIVSAWAGHLSRVDENVALMVSVDSREGMVAQTAAYMAKLSNDRALGDRLGKAARDRALSEMLWSEKIDRFLADIGAIVAARAYEPKPVKQRWLSKIGALKVRPTIRPRRQK